MNAATRTEQPNSPFFIFSLLPMVPGLGVMVPSDVDAPKLQKRPDSPVTLMEKQWFQNLPAVERKAAGVQRRSEQQASGRSVLKRTGRSFRGFLILMETHFNVYNSINSVPASLSIKM
jgi:hypothetical protein